MEAQQQQPSGDATQIAENKADLALIKKMKAELAAAVAASNFTQVQVLATRLRVTELKQQLKLAVAADNFAEVTRLGHELDEYKRSPAPPLAEPTPEPQPAADVDLGAGAVWGSKPNPGAAAAYRAWEDKLVTPDQPDDSDYTDDSGEMKELQFLDEPNLVAPTVTVMDAQDGTRPGALVRWQLIGTHRHDPDRQVENILNTKCIICNTKSIIFNAKSSCLMQNAFIFNTKSIHF